METKIQSIRAQRVIKSLDILNFLEIPAEGFSGDLWFLWNESVNFPLENLKSTARFVHCRMLIMLGTCLGSRLLFMVIPSNVF